MDGGVSRHDLAIYFAVALPLCVIVFFIARLPIFGFAGLGQAFGRARILLRKVL